MSDLLTQEEIDALLGEVDDFDFDDYLGQETDAEDVPAESRIRKYDFTRREKIVRGELQALERIHERFSGFFTKSLSSFLGSSVEIDQSAIQVQQFSEYTQGLPLQTHFTIARFSPLRGYALIAMEPRLIFTVIDHYFGGGVQSKSPVEKKPLSPIMRRVTQRVLDLIFKDLKEAWKPVMELDFDYLDPEINPAFANIAGSDEIVIILTNHIRLKGGNGDFTIAMPYSMIKSVKNLFDNQDFASAEDDQLWQLAFRDHILQAEVNVAARLTDKQMAIGDVMQLKEGDVIPIDHPDRVVLSVQDVPIYEGKASISGGRNALQIIGRIDS